MALGDADHAADGGDVDDCGRPAVLLVGCFLQERDKGDAHKVGTVDVGFVGVDPVLVWELVRKCGFVMRIWEVWEYAAW